MTDETDEVGIIIAKNISQKTLAKKKAFYEKLDKNKMVKTSDKIQKALSESYPDWEEGDNQDFLAASSIIRSICNSILGQYTYSFSAFLSCHILSIASSLDVFATKHNSYMESINENKNFEMYRADIELVFEEIFENLVPLFIKNEAIEMFYHEFIKNKFIESLDALYGDKGAIIRMAIKEVEGGIN